MASNEINKPFSPSKKKKLGRGLGSLLGENASSLDEVDIAPIAFDDSPVEIEKRPMAKAKMDEATMTKPVSPTSVVKTKDIDETKYKESKLWKIDIEKLSANRQQPRKHFDKEKLKELSDSIKVHGIMSPIVARKKRDGGFEIIAGERRWRAAQAAGLDQVPVILKEIENKQSLEWALIENIQRHDLNPIEEGHAYKRLMEDYGLTQAEAAERLGKERSTIANAVRLLLLPAEVTQFISEGLLSAGHAKVLLAIGDPARQIEIAKRVIDEKLSVRKTEELIKEVPTTNSDSITKKAKDEVAELLVKTLTEELQKAVGTKVEIAYKKGKGKIQLHFYSDEQLNHISEKLK